MRMPSPRLLLVAGLVLLAVAIAGAVLLTPGPQRRPVATTAAAPPPAPFRLRASVAGVEPYAVTLSWQTPAPSTGRIVWGPDGVRPVLWTTWSRPDTRHVAVLTGLAASTAYTIRLAAHTAGGDRPSRTIRFTTAAPPAAPAGSVRDGTVTVDGLPTFPLLAWDECPSGWTTDLAAGITLFAGNPCSGLQPLLASLAGRALVAGTTDDGAATSQAGLLGWFYPDEADGRGLTAATLPSAGAGLRFLTLSSHFFTGAAPLPDGRGMYPGLIARADVVGFDLYPLQGLCRPGLLTGVYDAQRQLVQAAGPAKATFQWIEDRAMDCPQPADAVTPAATRVEAWLAVAAGARGLGFFPNASQGDAQVVATIRGIAARIRQLEPALLQPLLPVRVQSRSPAVRASARGLAGALYVLVVNSDTRPALARLTLAPLGDRRLELVDGRGSTRAHGGTLDLRLPPRTVRIYAAPPA